MDYWLTGSGYDSTSIITANGHNATVNDSFLSLTAKRGSYAEKFPVYKNNRLVAYKTVRRPFTEGRLSSRKRDFKYGYCEAKIRMPDNYYTDLYGSYWDNGFWLYNVGADIDWSEFDFEIVSNGAHGEAVNTMECNMHMEKPKGISELYQKIQDSAGGMVWWNVGKMLGWPSAYWIKVYFPPGVYSDPSHFSNQKIDPSPYRTSYINKYETTSLSFNHGWHILAYEWLPDQIKFYLDNKLWFRLEGDYKYTYTDIFGNADTLFPVHELNLGMPLFFNIDPSPKTLSNGDIDTSGTGPDSLSMDIKYVKYYTLKSDPCGTSGFSESGAAPYEMCGNYVHKVYSSVDLGDSTGTCPSCEVTVNGVCRISVRAKIIKLFDGFSAGLGEGEFYACDVDLCH